MTQTASSTHAATAADRPDPAATESILPELRTTWWETGMRARAKAGLFAVFAELPGLVRAAVRVSWRADRTRT
ncbi:hypothetical protein ACFQ0D_27600, partial [Micromonospora zhanjiangensis]